MSRAVSFACGGDRMFGLLKLGPLGSNRGMCWRTIEEIVPNNLLIQSLEVVAVILVKVWGEFGVVVLIPACSGEARGCFPSSSTLASRLGRVRWRCLVV
ncbi:hypothetical protein HID58_038782 [Brassica napus]|uniref:Uncharacterized protein n=1 Tax=Brassica napus TaxID=3708 RepID=A0ABQ8BRU3_BRANA|nr:hypothetical protein HID58_038782 [Brassica napus]